MTISSKTNMIGVAALGIAYLLHMPPAYAQDGARPGTVQVTPVDEAPPSSAELAIVQHAHDAAVAAPIAPTMPVAVAPTPLEDSVADRAEEIANDATPAPKPASKKTHKKKIVKKDDGAGPRVSDILSLPAPIRPLPEKYLVVRKEQDAGTTDSRLTAARLALSRGRYQAALQLFNDLYRENPLDDRVTMGRAVAFQKLGQNPEAISAYEAALQRNPQNVEALTNMMGLLKGQNQDAAIEKLKQLRELYPANADVAAQLGTLYGQAGDYQNAIRYLDMADALKPDNSSILFNRAVAYDRMGKTGKAAELYRQLVQLANTGALEENFPLDLVRQRLAALR